MPLLSSYDGHRLGIKKKKKKKKLASFGLRPGVAGPNKFCLDSDSQHFASFLIMFKLDPVPGKIIPDPLVSAGQVLLHCLCDVFA
jgi:hypothetical protein